MTRTAPRDKSAKGKQWYLNGLSKGRTAPDPDGARRHLCQGPQWYLNGLPKGRTAPDPDGTQRHICKGPQWYLNGLPKGLTASDPEGDLWPRLTKHLVHRPVASYICPLLLLLLWMNARRRPARLFQTDNILGLSLLS